MIALAFRCFTAPLAMLGCGAVLAAVCGCFACFSCRRCRLRDCGCFRWLLRCSGHDKYDDFELLVQVHAASFQAQKKPKTRVRLTAGEHTVTTQTQKKHIYQEVLSILIEQGTNQLHVDLLTDSGAVLANLKLDVSKDIRNAADENTKVYHMNQKQRGVLNPTVTLTLHKSEMHDEENPLLVEEHSCDAETLFLMKKHLSAAQHEVSTKNSGCGINNSMRGAISESNKGDLEVLDVLVQAACGPVELFQGFGGATKMYLSIIGPPVSRRFVIGLWKDKSDVESRKTPEREVDALKVVSVQADPGRTDVFVISYVDNQHVSRKMTIRIVDRPTKVWVETLSLLITKIHNLHSNCKHERRAHKMAADARSNSINRAKSFGRALSNKLGASMGASQSLRAFGHKISRK